MHGLWGKSLLSSARGFRQSCLAMAAIARDNQTQPPFLTHQAHVASFPSFSLTLVHSSRSLTAKFHSFRVAAACQFSLPRRLFAIHPLVADFTHENLSPQPNSSGSGCIVCHLHDHPALASVSRLTHPGDDHFDSAPDVNCACIAPADGACVPQLNPVALARIVQFA